MGRSWLAHRGRVPLRPRPPAQLSRAVRSPAPQRIDPDGRAKDSIRRGSPSASDSRRVSERDPICGQASSSRRNRGRRRKPSWRMRRSGWSPTSPRAGEPVKRQPGRGSSGQRPISSGSRRAPALRRISRGLRANPATRPTLRSSRVRCTSHRWRGSSVWTAKFRPGAVCWNSGCARPPGTRTSPADRTVTPRAIRPGSATITASCWPAWKLSTAWASNSTRPWIARERRLFWTERGASGLPVRQYRLILEGDGFGPSWSGRLVLVHSMPPRPPVQSTTHH